MSGSIRTNANTKLKEYLDFLRVANNTNNFIDTNSDKINQDLFTMTGNQVPDYHNDSGSAIGNGRCGRQGANIATVEDGDADDLQV